MWIVEYERAGRKYIIKFSSEEEAIRFIEDNKGTINKVQLNFNII